jgi:hypothetical protein
LTQNLIFVKTVKNIGEYPFLKYSYASFANPEKNTGMIVNFKYPCILLLMVGCLGITTTPPPAPNSFRLKNAPLLTSVVAVQNGLTVVVQRYLFEMYDLLLESDEELVLKRVNSFNIKIILMQLT